ncbi:MAG: thiamine pyrophosphate-dependent dehydrogenase E1 component subunit alpha [Acidobacteriota bacterium]|nr:thiamine pyrophosphate-dependent dehydrogenase E1 component subunit alpha [Acidobacteriota bacterium]
MSKVLVEELNASVHADEVRALAKNDLLAMYRAMRMTREFEMRLVSLYRQGKIVGGVYTGTGNEAVSVGSASALGKDDILAPMHRDLGALFVRGEKPRDMMCQYLGRRNGPTRGKDGNMHQGYIELNILGMISHLGALIPVAVGASLAGLMNGRKQVAMNYIGDGGSSIGEFHEGLNFAAVYKVPFVLIIENNQFAYSTPTHLQYACKDLVDRAVGYGVHGEMVDGNDVLAVYGVCKRAVERARDGGGPTLIEAKTMRMRGHSEHDDQFYVPKELLGEWRQRDPIMRFEKYLQDHNLLPETIRREIEREVLAEIDDAADFAERSPLPEGPEALEGVYAD